MLMFAHDTHLQTKEELNINFQRSKNTEKYGYSTNRIPQSLSEKTSLPDPFEQKNVTVNYPEVSKNLYQQLQNWLTSVNAKYPTIDTQFDAEKRKKYEEYTRTVRLKNLENERTNMLQPNFSPNKDWWGSNITVD